MQVRCARHQHRACRIRRGSAHGLRHYLRQRPPCVHLRWRNSLINQSSLIDWLIHHHTLNHKITTHNLIINASTFRAFRFRFSFQTWPLIIYFIIVNHRVLGRFHFPWICIRFKNRFRIGSVSWLWLQFALSRTPSGSPRSRRQPMLWRRCRPPSRLIKLTTINSLNQRTNPNPPFWNFIYDSLVNHELFSIIQKFNTM